MSSDTQGMKRLHLSGRILARGDSPASDANIANIITVVRILLAPFFIALVLVDGGADGALRWISAVVFVVVIVTDTLDGYLARSRNLTTDLGALLDPIADKVLVGGGLVALSVLGELWWWVTIVILVREFGITIFRFIALRSRVIPASRGGKLKTWLQSVAVTLLLLPLDRLVGEWYLVVAWVVTAAAFALTVITGVDYLWQAWRRNRRG